MVCMYAAIVRKTDRRCPDEGDYYRGKNCLADKQAFLKAYKESACEINRSEPLLLPVIIA